jgi:hypothetical protein
LAASDLILAVLSAVFGVIVATWFAHQRSASPTWLLFIVLCAIVCLIALLVTKMNEVKGIIEQTVPVGTSKVRIIPAAEISKTAVGLVGVAKTIRVIGTARQDIVGSDEAARSYLMATEQRARRQPKLFYRRITSGQLASGFQSHLERMLRANGEKMGHDIQIALVDHIECAISYQIFDDTHGLLIIDAPTVPGVRDNASAVLIEETSIVAALTAHFDHAWSLRGAIRTVEALRVATGEQNNHRRS